MQVNKTIPCLEVFHVVLQLNYVESILKNWSNKNIRSVEEAIALQERWRHQNSLRQAKAVREEKVPEWFSNRSEHATPTVVLTDLDIEAERERLLQELRG